MMLCVQDPSWEDLFAPFREVGAPAQNGPAVIISVLGHPFSLTVQDVTALSKAQFAIIYTVSSSTMPCFHCNVCLTFLSICVCPVTFPSCGPLACNTGNFPVICRNGPHSTNLALRSDALCQ